jgi:acetyl esterase/lipase
MRFPVIPRRTTPPALLALLIAASSCALELPDRTGMSSTTGQARSGDTTVPGDPLPSTTDASGGPAPSTTTLVPLDPVTFESLSGIHIIPNFSGRTSRSLSRWEREVPEVEDIRITSTADGAEQPAIWLAPSGDRDQPLLVVLHSWSAPYNQHASIPFALWARENGWALIAPNYRGANTHADALASELAVQDVVDAIDFAVAQDGVDPDRVYTVGYSGGGMMSLILAGRHPDRVTAVAAWSPVYDLIDFYRRAGQSYPWQIWTACGGNPTTDEEAEAECRRRSPSTYLDAARESGVPVFVAQGAADWLLPPSHSVSAFNVLADPDDRLTAEEVEEIGRRRLPEHLAGEVTSETFFGDGDPVVVFARQSARVWLVLFQAGHEMAYAPALRWFATDPR